MTWTIAFFQGYHPRPAVAPGAAGRYCRRRQRSARGLLSERFGKKGEMGCVGGVVLGIPRLPIVMCFPPGDDFRTNSWLL
jgi:hypothetical protein